MAGTSRRHWSEDDDLADEIELYGELVVAASESSDGLTLPQIDRVLGVDQDGDGHADEIDVRDEPPETTDATSRAVERSS